MIALATIIERFAPLYLQRYGSTVLPSQRQALTAMASCRSTMARRMLAQCGQCGEQRLVPHSCGHRLCPHCQHFEGQRWIERQTQALVSAPYFLVTFTVPAELRALLWQHQRALYAALMDCAWSTLATFGQNHRKLRGQMGAVAVLHTHSRQLAFHPHVHLAMPAAALDADNGLWRPCALVPRARAICSTTRRWPGCFAPGSWRRCARSACSRRTRCPSSGWSIARRWGEKKEATM